MLKIFKLHWLCVYNIDCLKTKKTVWNAAWFLIFLTHI